MFDEHFPPSCAGTVMRWTPKWSKQTDPSGRYGCLKALELSEDDMLTLTLYRAIAVHNAKYDNA